MAEFDWIPLYIDKLLGSQDFRFMTDYQRGWYLSLLVESVQSSLVGYLKLDADLWRLAGARSRQFFERENARVLACFERKEISGQVWLYSERMVRTVEEQREKMVKKRRRKSDDSFSLSYSPDSLEVDLGIKPPNSDELVERIWRKHPANWMDRGRALTVPPSHAMVIIKHIAENGPELVEQGTQRYAEAVRQWPESERTLRNIFSVTKFYDTYEYLKPASRWERTNGQGTGSKQQERLKRSCDAIYESFAGDGGSDAGPGNGEVRQGTDQGGGRLLEGDIGRAAKRGY